MIPIATWQALARVAALGVVLAATSCADGSPSTGTLTLEVTDAPYPFDLIAQANLTIDEVRVRIGSEQTGEDDDEGFLVLDAQPHELTLLDLRNGVTELLVQAEVPVGELDQIRLRVSSARVVLVDGREFDLKVPSGEESGLKVFPWPPITVAGDLTTELLLDFDVTRSFEAIPASARKVEEITGFHFRPTLRVANLSETGTLSGRVSAELGGAAGAPIANATVTAVGAGQTYATATDPDGYFKLMGLPAGAYTLTASAAGYLGAGLTAAVVAGNDVGGNDFTLVLSGLVRESGGEAEPGRTE